MDHFIRMHDMTRENISEKANAGYAIIVPLAATEQHGPHLPVFTDSLISEYIVTRAVRKASEHASVLMTPVQTIGCSQHHLSFGGTLSLRSDTYLNVLRDIGESLVIAGFKKIIFINSHGGNEPIMTQMANDLAVAHPIWTASASYWNIARNRLDALNAKEVGMVPGHAGGFETAAILAIKPGLVRKDRISSAHIEREWLLTGPPRTFIGKHGELTGHQGFTDAPHRATAAKGQLYLDAIVESVSDWLISVVHTMDKGGEPCKTDFLKGMPDL